MAEELEENKTVSLRFQRGELEETKNYLRIYWNILDVIYYWLNEII